MERRHRSRLGPGMLGGLLLVLPFAALEISHTTGTLGQLPFPLFGVMWALAMISVTALAPVVRAVTASTAIVLHPVAMALRLAVGAGAALMWIWIVQDQMPCFLGVPNCD